jgi:hypothetical protein
LYFVCLRCFDWKAATTILQPQPFASTMEHHLVRATP